MNAQNAGHLTLHPLVQRLCLFAIHICLAQNREADAIVYCAELLDIVVCVRITMTKLIARKRDELDIISVFCFEVLSLVKSAHGLRVWETRTSIQRFEIGELGCEGAF